MKKLLLFLDEWKNDKNFVASELDCFKNQFEVTVICNDFKDKDSFTYPEGVKFFFYKRKGGIKIIIHLLKMIFDFEFYKELRNLKDEDEKISKISEIVRFYINAECFYDFLKKNKLITKEETFYYSYWYFYKCFAITKHRKDLNGQFITRTHQYDLYTESIPTGYHPFKYAMDKNLDKIVFIAEHGRQYYLEKYGFNSGEKYALYHLGTKDYGKSNPYVKRDEIVLASCSSVIPRKRVNYIVEALSQIDTVKIKWVHFGTGELFEDLKKQAKDLLDKKDNISYELMGYTKHDDIMKYYKENSIDAFVMVAVSEGNPVSVMEAMSFGIPVISYNICNMPNMVIGNGLLIDEKASPKELAECIEKFSGFDDETISKFRQTSRDIWERDYNQEINNKKFIEEVILQ